MKAAENPEDKEEEMQGKGEEPIEEAEEAEKAEGEAEAEEKPLAEEKLKPARGEAIEEEVVEERIYTVPLGRAWIMPPNKRAARAVRILKEFLKRHMKLGIRVEDEEEERERLIITNEVNERIWSRGVEKPPRRIRVRAAKDKNGNVTVYLAEGD